MGVPSPSVHGYLLNEAKGIHRMGRKWKGEKRIFGEWAYDEFAKKSLKGMAAEGKLTAPWPLNYCLSKIP
jgi:hypothetical protein